MALLSLLAAVEPEGVDSPTAEEEQAEAIAAAFKARPKMRAHPSPHHRVTPTTRPLLTTMVASTEEVKQHNHHRLAAAAASTNRKTLKVVATSTDLRLSKIKASLARST